jgi:undecaprenyl-diphosphatase
MAIVRIRPTGVDIAIANTIASHADRRAEKVAEITTWGGDEHVLCALATGWWVFTRNKNANWRRAGDHILLTTLVASVLPHLLKSVVDQERPDRLTVRGHWRGVPLSGKRLDAFPSGHAVHIGALASAASVLQREQRAAFWCVGAAVVLTRIVLLAHWTSDVAVGLVVGTLIERLLRPVTGYGRQSLVDTTGETRSKTGPSRTRKQTHEPVAVAEPG